MTKQLDRYETLFPEEKEKLIEMATIGKVGQMKIIVWTDHNPPHFHVEKKDEYEARISIKTLKIIDYKYQKNNKTMSSTGSKNLLKWLNSPSKKNPNITNLEGVKYAWNILNKASIS